VPQHAVALRHQLAAVGKKGDGPEHAFAFSDLLQRVTVPRRADHVAGQVLREGLLQAVALDLVNKDHHRANLFFIQDAFPARHSHVGHTGANGVGDGFIAGTVNPFVIDQGTSRTAREISAVTACTVLLV
jgi:hypothetical protein